MSAKRELDEIKVAYLAAHEAGEAPSLDEVVARHPQYYDELVDFITALIELERVIERAPEPPEPSTSTRRLREQAVLLACGTETLREALATAGVSREQVATAVNVPVEAIVRIERGRLILDDDEPVDPVFVSRLATVLSRTADEVVAILRATVLAPAPRRSAGHARGTGQPGMGKNRAPQSFRALLAGCHDLTSDQRREWLGDEPTALDKQRRQL